MIPFSLDAVYGFQAKNLTIPATPTFNQQLFYGGFASNILFHNCAIAMGRLEMPTYSYISFTNDSITVPLMHLTGLLVNGGTAAVNLSNNTFFGLGVAVYNSITGFTMLNNVVNYMFTNPPPLTVMTGALAGCGKTSITH